jgi:hypothetical protein
VSAPGGPDPVAPVGGGMFEVNIAEAPKAIRELEHARDELASIREDAIGLAVVRPPAVDDVSVDAAKCLSLRAKGGPRSLMQALDEGIQETTRLIEALRSSFALYQQGDGSGRRSFAE